MSTKRSCIDFPRHARLLLPAEYNRIFAAGKRFSGAYVTLVAARKDLQQSSKSMLTSSLTKSTLRPRLGLALAKKQIKRAHERNRVKRLLRECFRANTSRLTGLELIAMAKTAAQKMSNSALSLEIERLISRTVDFFASAPTTEADPQMPVSVPQHISPIKNSEP